MPDSPFSGIAIAADPDRTIYLFDLSYVSRRPRSATTIYATSIGHGRSYWIDDLVLAADGRTLYTATHSGVFRSENGVDWVASGAITAIGASSLILDPHQTGVLYLLTDYGIVTGSGADTRISPSFVDLRGPQAFLVPDPLRAGTFYAAGPGLFKTTDGGKAWKSAGQGLPAAALEAVSALALDPRNGTTLYLGTSEKGLYRSTDGAASWQTAHNGLPASAAVSCLTVDPVTGVVFAGIIAREPSGNQSYGLYRSANAGATWNVIGNGLPSARINLVAFGGTAVQGVLFLGTEGQGVFRSDDDGLNWKPASHGLASDANIRALAVDSNGALFVAAYGSGVFTSRDGGIHWESLDQGLSNLWVTSLALDPADPRNLYVATSGGVFSLTLSPDFALSAKRNGKVTTGGAAAWSLNLANIGSAVNSGPIDIAFKIPAGLRLLKSAGSGWICADGGTNLKCVTQAHVERGKSSPPLGLTFEVDEHAPASMSTEIRADSPEDFSPGNDGSVDQWEVQAGAISRLPFLPPDQSTFLGLALSSWSALPTEVVLTALDREGKLLDRPRNPVFLTLEPGAQLARMISELFGDGPGSANQGWLRIAADQPVGSLYQFGADDQLDGGIPAQALSRTLYFTRICEGPKACWGNTGRTVIGLANPGESPVTVRVVLFETDNGSSRHFVRSIPPKGSFTGSLSELFGLSVNGGFTVPPRPVRGGFVKVEVVEEYGGIVGAERVELTETRSLVSLPGQPAASTLTLYSAQLADVPGLFTRLQLINGSQEVRSIRVRALGDDGEPIANQKELQLEPTSATDVDCAGWLEWLPGRTHIGTLVVEADGPGLLGHVLFGGQQGETAAALPLETVASSDMSFGQVANGMGLYTGLALYNPTSQPVEVSISVSRADGSPSGDVKLTLPPGARLSRLVSELLPSTAGQIGGAIAVSASAAIIAQELFGSAAMLSAVPPQ